MGFVAAAVPVAVGAENAIGRVAAAIAVALATVTVGATTVTALAVARAAEAAADGRAARFCGQAKLFAKAAVLATQQVR